MQKLNAEIAAQREAAQYELENVAKQQEEMDMLNRSMSAAKSRAEAP